MGIIASIKGLMGMADVVETGCDIAERATEGVFKGLDAVWYTDEEKAKSAAERSKLQLSFWKQFATENSEQSKARREIAWLLIKTFVGVLFIGIFMIVFEEYEMLTQLIAWLAILKFAWIVGSIILTYFVPHQAQKMFKK